MKHCSKGIGHKAVVASMHVGESIIVKSAIEAKSLSRAARGIGLQVKIRAIRPAITGYWVTLRGVRSISRKP